ncbi:MAG: MopE-related protein, partial [Bacteroidota bacterium]
NGITCTDSVTVTVNQPQLYYADLDADTFGAGTAISTCTPETGYVLNNSDCDDANANINTSVSEICNDIDDNCNNLIDDGLTFQNYYADTDNDSFGAGNATSSCSDLGAGYVLDNTDCNDNDANVNEASTEICNDIDDNCNNLIDDGLTFQNYYADADNDSFGAGTATSSCSDLGAGYVLDNTDCNDNDANVNPAAEDIAGNGIDENCDGQIDNGVEELSSSFTLFPNPATTELNLQTTTDLIGSDLIIFDALGKQIHKQQILSTTTRINTTAFAAGNYVVKVGGVVKRVEVKK